MEDVTEVLPRARLRVGHLVFPRGWILRLRRMRRRRFHSHARSKSLVSCQDQILHTKTCNFLHLARRERAHPSLLFQALVAIDTIINCLVVLLSLSLSHVSSRLSRLTTPFCRARRAGSHVRRFDMNFSFPPAHFGSFAKVGWLSFDLLMPSSWQRGGMSRRFLFRKQR